MTRGKVGMAAASIDPRHAPSAQASPVAVSAICPARALLGGALAAGSALLLPRPRPGPSATTPQLRFARLHLPDLPNPRPTALRRLAWEIERRTSLVTVPEPIELRATDPELFRHPFLLLSGDRGFAPPPEAEVVRLRRYLTYGGFLLIDSAEGRASGRFDESVRKLLARTLPGDLPARVADDHVIWKSFYVLRGAAGRILAAPYIEAVERDRRLAVVYTQNDLVRRAGPRRLRPLGARGHPGRRSAARAGLPLRGQRGDVRLLPGLQDRAGPHRLHPAHPEAARDEGRGYRGRRPGLHRLAHRHRLAPAARRC